MGKFTKTLAKMSKGEQKGFTLIELLIVVAILGILAAVIIPNVSSFMKSGNVAAANTELQNVKTAALAYYSDNESGGWPTSSNQLGSFLAGGTAGLKAQYTFDGGTGTGYVIGASIVSSGYTGIGFSTPAGTPGAYPGDGKWTKN